MKDKKANKLSDRPKITKKELLKFLPAGAFTGLVGIFYYQSVQYLPASIAIILLMQNVWISILIEFLVFKKKPTTVQVIAMFLVLGGTVFAAGLLEDSVQLNAKGIMFGLLAAISYSVFMLSSGRIGNNLPVSQKSALMITASCIMTFILYPKFGSMVHEWFQGGLLPWGLALALFGTVIPPFLFAKGVPMTGVSLSAILGGAELPVAVIASAVILKEHVSPLQIVGVIIILSAIVLTNLPKKAK